MKNNVHGNLCCFITILFSTLISGTTNWVHEVRSQITSQDKDAFKFWKKEANIMYKRIKGLELHELASQLNHLGMTARKRMTVTSKEDMDQDHQLDKISKASVFHFSL